MCKLLLGIFTCVILSTQPECNGREAQETGNQVVSMEKRQKDGLDDSLDVITLGGGCFWCVEAVYEELRGVVKVVSGYSGGSTENPSYKEVCTGSTGHAEVTQIYYDPEVVTLETVLDVFWSTHDPTTPNKQGYDEGPQYRSIILYHDSHQKDMVLKSIEGSARELWGDNIVTEVVPFEVFYPAEDEHQDFYQLNPNYGYCRAVINPKMEKFRKKFEGQLKQ